MTKTLFRPLISQPARHAYGLATNSKYRALCRAGTIYRRIGRFTPFTIKVDGYQVEGPDIASFVSNYDEIFVNEIYKFNCSKPSPQILDLGSNIGLSILYFKRLFPNSMITAVEADPSIFSYLEKNVEQNGLTGVELLNRAVWYEEAQLSFQSDGADGGAISAGQNGAQTDSKTITIDTIDIRTLLTQPYDFLKIDIEGAETDLFSKIDLDLSQIANIFIEYHSIPGQAQHLEIILENLNKQGFRYGLQNVFCPAQPFIDRRESGFDFQTNIFAWRS